MKTIYLIVGLLTIFILNSCSNIVFKHAVPQEEKNLSEFPKKVRGTYIDDESDTLVISKNAYTYGKIDNHPLFQGELNEEMVLRKYKDFYFLNFRSNDHYWEMIAAQISQSQLILYSIDIENSEQIKIIEEFVNGDCQKLNKDDKYMIDPDLSQLLNMLEDERICQKSILRKIK